MVKSVGGEDAFSCAKSQSMGRGVVIILLLAPKTSKGSLLLLRCSDARFLFLELLTRKPETLFKDPQRPRLVGVTA
jgi:hypothetical protein